MAETRLAAVGGFTLDALADYSRRCADSMGLRDFEVVLDHDPCTDGDVAVCCLAQGRRRIDLAVCVGFERLPVEDQRHAVVHELTHALVFAVERSVPAVARWMPPATFEMWRDGLHRDVEHVVDVLAVLLAPLAPLPEWG